MAHAWPRWANPELYCWWMFVVSYYNLLFNLLPIFPLDGGRILQSCLWPSLGYYRSMMLTTGIGMGAAGALGLFGLLSLTLLIVLVALWCFMSCRQERMMLKAEGHEPWEVELPDFSSSLYNTPSYGEDASLSPSRSIDCAVEKGRGVRLASGSGKQSRGQDSGEGLGHGNLELNVRGTPGASKATQNRRN